MLVNADFTRRVIIQPGQHQWVSSPQKGVERVMLDRVGDEVARATSLVRYAPQSNFPHHSHPEGEEILVLSGTFSEHNEHFPAGWYLRNPPGSGHQPSSNEGALLFVKLRQMPHDEQRYVRINTGDAAAWQQQANCQVCKLFTSDYEDVRLLRLSSNAALPELPGSGVELLVLHGSVIIDGQACESHSWARLPASDTVTIRAGEDGATLYLKTGHLRQP
jgi:anti-sigma factor ChrR (cupin superfamily)